MDDKGRRVLGFSLLGGILTVVLLGAIISKVTSPPEGVYDDNWTEYVGDWTSSSERPGELNLSVHSDGEIKSDFSVGPMTGGHRLTQSFETKTFYINWGGGAQTPLRLSSDGNYLTLVGLGDNGGDLVLQRVFAPTPG
ncbi:hypothetical protein [Nonomuraea polychroma]|uniref:hypothetical protein n=1 Tax=Nonomuraea polychroma TaxID=46176 RepID=UPI000FDDCB46|nr:hypothetical protein [Nonomuraea polychroma]